MYWVIAKYTLYRIKETAVEMKISLFWHVTQRRLVVTYGHFGKNGSRIQGSHRLVLANGTDSLLRNVGKYQCMLRNMSEGWRLRIYCGGAWSHASVRICRSFHEVASRRKDSLHVFPVYMICIVYWTHKNLAVYQIWLILFDSNNHDQYQSTFLLIQLIHTIIKSQEC